MSAKIKQIKSLEILDSRGFPTVEAEVRLDDGTTGRAAVPSGASTGAREALALRDGAKSRDFGKGVQKAAAFVIRDLNNALVGQDPRDQRGLDETMLKLDGTANKGRYGANAILAVSLAAARAAAASAQRPLYAWLREAYGLKLSEWLLPTPMFNVINGGKHADSGLDIQEFMVVPTGLANFSEAVRSGAEIYQSLKKSLSAKGLATSVGDEGGFAPKLKNHAEALELIRAAAQETGYGNSVRLSLDCAASEFFKNGSYLFEKSPRSPQEMGKIYADWTERFALASIEDPLSENDWDGWKALTDSIGARVRLVGDDLFVTNPERLGRGISSGTANSILIKLNQIGTLTETVDTVLTAQKAGFSCIISHRSGETEDAFIADLAVALNAGAIKTGAPCRSERLAKYNQLLRIEAELGDKARYAGSACFSMPAATR